MPNVIAGAMSEARSAGARSFVEFLALLLIAAVYACPRETVAQEYPNRPIKMIIPYPAASAADVLARFVAGKLQESLGQPIMLENRASVFGTSAHHLVATSPPDGYTIGMSGIAPLVLAPHQYKNLPYDPLKDFAYLSCAGKSPLVLEITPELPVRNVNELVAYAKAYPGKLNFGSAGVGNSAHLAAELFKRETGIDMVHIPYKRDALAMTDLIAGRIQILFDPVQISLPQIRGQRVRPLAVTSKVRSEDLPEVPTVAESGYPAYEFVEWYVLIAPAATPTRIVDQLNSEINRILRDPLLKVHFTAQGATPSELTPEGCATFVQSELALWDKVFVELGIEPE